MGGFGRRRRRRSRRRSHRRRWTKKVGNFAGRAAKGAASAVKKSAKKVKCKAVGSACKTMFRAGSKVVTAWACLPLGGKASAACVAAGPAAPKCTAVLPFVVVSACRATVSAGGRFGREECKQSASC